MRFKISSYVVYSKPVNGEYSDKGKRVIFSSRTGQGLVVTNYLAQKLTLGEIEEIPLQTFLKLCSLEILIPEKEDELKIVIERKIAEAHDLKTIRYFLEISELTNVIDVHEFINQLPIQKFDFLLILLNCAKGWRPQIEEVKFLIGRLSIIERELNWKCSIKLLTDFNQIDFSMLGKFIYDLNIKEFELRIYNNDDYDEAKLKKFLYEVEKKDVTIVFRLFLGLKHSGLFLNLLELISIQRYNNCRFIFSNDQSLSRDEFANIEIFWLTKLREFGINSEYLPSPGLGVYSISSNGCSRVVSESILKLVEVDRSNGFNLVLRDFSEEDMEYLKSGESPCSTCKILPLCGGASKDAWSYFGEKLCPSYLENLEHRALLVYHNDPKPSS